MSAIPVDFSAMPTSIDFSRISIALSSPAGWIELALVVVCLAVAWGVDQRVSLKREHAAEVVRVGLGGINRLRRAVYEASAAFRHIPKEPAHF